MIPPKSDPCWEQIVLGEDSFQVQALPAKMLMMRVRLLAKDRTPQKIALAIEIAHDFFSKNSDILSADIKNIFKSINESKS
jgi:hypothetical protein